MEKTESDYLVHYGVLGMKWGVRNDRNRGGKSSSKRSIFKRKSKFAKNKIKRPTKNPKKMTDEELKKKVARLQLEKQYRDLTKKELTPGQKLAQDMVRSGALNVSSKVSSKVGSLLAEELEKNWKKR